MGWVEGERLGDREDEEGEPLGVGMGEGGWGAWRLGWMKGERGLAVAVVKGGEEFRG